MDAGEVIDVSERVIVSPAVGIYQPLALVGPVEAGEVIGHVAAADRSTIPVCSPFRGRLVEVVAWPGERVVHHQRIAWLRVA